MLTPLAHITSIEIPVGLLLFLAGFAIGALTIFLVSRARTS